MLDALKTSKWLYLAATLMFAGATFQVVDGHWLPAVICIAAAASFAAIAGRRRREETDEGSPTE